MINGTDLRMQISKALGCPLDDPVLDQLFHLLSDWQMRNSTVTEAKEQLRHDPTLAQIRKLISFEDANVSGGVTIGDIAGGNLVKLHLVQPKANEHYEYDVALSYAKEDREYADALAEALQRRKLNVFYDKYEKSDLWGKNLYTHLSEVYQNKALYCVMLLSRHYAAKQWTKHEREAAQARAFNQNKEYILPVRLDNTVIPGIPSTVAYLSWPPENAETIADTIMEKVEPFTVKRKIRLNELKSLLPINPYPILPQL